jgi:hypothetical protein
MVLIALAAAPTLAARVGSTNTNEIDINQQLMKSSPSINLSHLSLNAYCPLNTNSIVVSHTL